MIEVVKLEPWHIEVLNSEGVIDPAVYSPEYSNYLSRNGTAVALIVDGHVRACGGVIDLWPGVADGWALVTDWLRQNPVLLVKTFKKFFDGICPDYNRVQITVVNGFEKAEAFAEFLGFTPEGRMKYYSPTGETHIRYARTK